MERILSCNLCPEKQNVVMELEKGKENAIQLQELFLQVNFGDEGLRLTQELAQKVLRSITDSLAMLGSCGSTQTCQIGAAVDRGLPGCSGDLKFQAFEDKRKRSTEMKDRRGCYKRRRVAESWVTVSPTMEDGYAWRKYGQKLILNSKHPRCYFRCTHKYDQECRAIKQVQKLDQETDVVYQTTYFIHHTCKNTSKSPQIVSESDPMESNLISFQMNNSRTNNINIPSSAYKQESRDETESDLTDNKSSMNSNMWEDLVAASGSPGSMLEYSPKIGNNHEEVVSSEYTGGVPMPTGFDMKNFVDFSDFNSHDFPFDENEFF